jgi:hypothetical protein
MIPVGLEPTTYGLTCHFGFRRRAPTSPRVRGLDSLFACTCFAVVVLRRPPSSLYTFRPGAKRTLGAAWLGIGM